MGELIFLIGVSCIVYIDASYLRRQSETRYKETLRLEPALWAAAFLFLFFVAAAIYLLRRQKFQKEYRYELSQTGGQSQGLELYRITDATGIIILWSFILFFSMVIFFIWPPLRAMAKGSTDAMIPFYIFPTALMMILIYELTHKSPYQGFLTSVGFRKKNQSAFKIFIIPMLVGLAFACLSTFLMAVRKVNPTTPFSESVEAIQSPFALGIFVGLAILIAPLVEELIFRGYFFSVVEKFKGIRFAICLMAILFGLLHVDQYWGDWLAIAMVFVLGFALSGLRVLSGSTIASVVTHYTYNISMLLIPLAILIFSNASYLKYVVFYNQLSAIEKEEFLLESIQKQPDFTVAYNDLAWAYALENKNLDEALELVEKALIAEPDNPAYLDTKAEVFYRMGRTQEAVSIEADLAKKNPLDKMFRDQLKKFKEALRQAEMTDI